MYCGWGTQEYFCEGHDEDNKTFNDVFANEWCTGLDWIKRVSRFHRFELAENTNFGFVLSQKKIRFIFRQF